MSSRTRALVLAIDAASPALLRRWAADGTMPNLRALMARGLTGELKSLEGFFISSTVPTLYTGLNPGRHGFHYTVQLIPGTYRYQRAELDLPGFWRNLSQAGKRVALLDLPLSRVDSGINGVQVVDWSGVEATFGFDTHPAALREDIVSRFGKYPLQRSCDGLRSGPEEFGDLVNRLVKGVDLRAELTLHFLEQGGWDFFMQTFTEAHCVGHQCWHLHDPSHPSHDAATAKAIGDPMRKVYSAIDRAIGKIVAAAGDTPVIVFTAHGMDFWFGAQFLLPDILLKLGATVPPEGQPPDHTESTGRGIARQLWHLVPGPLRDAVNTVRRKTGSRSDPVALPSVDVDTSRSRCFVVRNGHVTGGIRLNLLGREPTGVLAPGAEADAFCDELTRDLLEIIDERTGRPAVKRVMRTATVYHGDHMDHLPDLLVDWDNTVPTGSSHHAAGAAAMVRLRSPKIGMLEMTNTYTRTGDHRIEGLLVAAGPGIRHGVLGRVVPIEDLGPTFAVLGGVDMPGVDGRPIPEIVGG